MKTNFISTSFIRILSFISNIITWCIGVVNIHFFFIYLFIYLFFFWGGGGQSQRGQLQYLVCGCKMYTRMHAYTHAHACTCCQMFIPCCIHTQTCMHACSCMHTFIHLYHDMKIINNQSKRPLLKKNIYM